MSGDVTEELEALARAWWHGHDELTEGCALCIAEYQEARRVVLEQRGCNCPQGGCR